MVQLFDHAVHACGEANAVFLLTSPFETFLHSLDLSNPKRHLSLQAGCQHTCDLQVRSIGKRDCSSLFKLGDEMIAFTALHQLLASSVADMLPVNVSVLLCDEAKRLARQSNPRVEGSPHRQTSVELSQPGSKTFEGLMSSPWKVNHTYHAVTWS